MTTEHDPENEVRYDQDLEDRILRIVEKIRQQRNRPCIDNITTCLNRGGRSMEKGQVSVFIKHLIDSKILINTGNADKESYRIADTDVGSSQEQQTQQSLDSSSVDSSAADTDDNVSILEITPEKAMDPPTEISTSVEPDPNTVTTKQSEDIPSRQNVEFPEFIY